MHTSLRSMRGLSLIGTPVPILRHHQGLWIPSIQSGLVPRRSFASSPPPAQVTQNKLLSSFKDGIAMFKQTLKGIKQLYVNASRLKTLEKSQSDPLTATPLTRSEYIFMHQTRIDLRRVIPFSFLALLLPEALPIVLVKGWLQFPSTCLTREQELKALEALDKKRKEVAERLLTNAKWEWGISRTDLAQPSTLLQWARTHPEGLLLHNIPKPTLSALNSVFGLSTWGFRKTLQKDLESHFVFLKQDDQYFLRMSPEEWSALTFEEMQRAANDRGISVIGKSLDDLKKLLREWIAMHQVVTQPGWMTYSTLARNSL